ncbi:MAG: dephospho-CoA kinase, partial [Spirochaeta sp.]|nr:dephospho-CoA kinase [Spirochaeta sp.]
MSSIKMVWGVTGKYCSGKNSVVNILKSCGFKEIDVDLLGHRVLEEQKTRVAEHFGRKILTGSGEIDRKKLGRLVFSDPAKLRILEAILHPVMVKRVEEQVKGAEELLVINAALLYHLGLHSLCDLLICVKANALVRYLRARKRDGLPFPMIISRIFAQKRICPKSNGQAVDIYYIRNNHGFFRVEEEIR